MNSNQTDAQFIFVRELSQINTDLKQCSALLTLVSKKSVKITFSELASLGIAESVDRFSFY